MNTKQPKKQDRWAHADGRSLRVFRSTIAVGSRHSLCKPSTCYNTGLTIHGSNFFATRADAHRHLIKHGFFSLA